MKIKEVTITGVQFAYFYICHRKLYLFSKGIQFESFHENVHIGKAIEEEYYQKSNKNLRFQGINIDMIGKDMVVHEIKKSNKKVEVDKLQVKYYLYILNEIIGINVEKGIIHYPTLNIIEEVTLEHKDIDSIKNDLIEINKILKGNIPKPINKRICNNCSYYEICYI